MTPRPYKESSERGWNQSGRGLRYSSTIWSIEVVAEKGERRDQCAVLTPVTASNSGGPSAPPHAPSP